VGKNFPFKVGKKFPFKVGKKFPFHIKFNENNIFSPIICKKFNVVTTCEFSICYKIMV
jgi:hypothetical protein